MGYVDIVKGLQYTGNIPQIYYSFLRRFAEYYKGFYWSNHKDSKIIHRLKGISLHLGAERLYKAINELENLEDKNDKFMVFQDIFKHTYDEVLQIIG